MPFPEPLSEINLEVEESPGLLLEEITALAEQLLGSSAHGEAGESRELAAKLKRQMKDIVHKITDGEGDSRAKFGTIALSGHFPKVIEIEHSPEWYEQNTQTTGKQQTGVSIHLCASDTRRLAPDPSREIVVWLTIVDLHQYNPMYAATGTLLTPKQEPFDLRPEYIVPGELACPLSAEEVERRLEEEEKRRAKEAEDELKKLQADRISRARSSRPPGTRPCSTL